MLKTVGFTNTRVTALVVAEAMTIALVGGLGGLGLAWLIINGAGDALRQFLPVFYLPGRDIAIGIGLMIVFGLVASAIPARQALRLRIADALRQGA